MRVLSRSLACIVHGAYFSVAAPSPCLKLSATHPRSKVHLTHQYSPASFSHRPFPFPQIIGNQHSKKPPLHPSSLHRQHGPPPPQDSQPRHSAAPAVLPLPAFPAAAPPLPSSAPAILRCLTPMPLRRGRRVFPTLAPTLFAAIPRRQTNRSVFSAEKKEIEVVGMSRAA